MKTDKVEWCKKWLCVMLNLTDDMVIGAELITQEEKEYRENYKDVLSDALNDTSVSFAKNTQEDEAEEEDNSAVGGLMSTKEYYVDMSTVTTVEDGELCLEASKILVHNVAVKDILDYVYLEEMSSMPVYVKDNTEHENDEDLFF